MQTLDSLRNNNYQLQDSLLTLLKSISIQFDTTTDITINEHLKNEYDRLNKAIEQSWDNRLRSEFSFVQHHLTSPLCLDVLQFNLLRPEAVKYYDVIEALYNQIPRALQNSEKGKRLHEDLSYCKNSQVDKDAPDFKARDLNGRIVSLKTFRDKNYVLLDFWASWCVPCRQEQPYLKQTYAEYHAKGLEIISASIDQDLAAWRTAIKKDSINLWRHIAVIENSPSIASLYFIVGVPTKILINKQGKIIGRWIGVTAENTRAMNEKLQNIFQSSPRVFLP